MKSETRPWGEFTVLKETDFYKTKEIIVKVVKDYPTNIIIKDLKYGL